MIRKTILEKEQETQGEEIIRKDLEETFFMDVVYSVDKLDNIFWLISDADSKE